MKLKALIAALSRIGIVTQQLRITSHVRLTPLGLYRPTFSVTGGEMSLRWAPENAAP